MIPLCSPFQQYKSHRDNIRQAVDRVFESGHYILGKEVTAFEKEFASYIGVDSGVGVGNGTDAIQLALLACDIGPGDEVITVSHTAVATVSAVIAVGATPVLVDVDPVYYTMDPKEVARALSPKTKAVLAVHLYGQPADIESIQGICKEKGLFLIEDCAQAHGAKFRLQRVGSFGHLSTFSFYPTKNLGAIGDGGFVAGRDAKLVERVRLLRQYGWEERYISSIHGLNSRLDEVQAAVLRVKLKTLDTDNAKRRYLAASYNETLLDNKTLILPECRKDTEPVSHLYVVRTERRQILIDKLNQAGIGYGIHYPVPIHLQRGYQDKCKTIGELPVTQKLANQVLSLPMFPELTSEEQQQVIRACHD